MARSHFIAGAMLATLSGCGKSAVQHKGVTAKKSEAVFAGKLDCRKLPDFVPIYANARLDACVFGSTEGGAKSGTVTYTTAATPSVVLAWSKKKSSAAGMVEAMSSPTLYGARAKGKRNLIVLTDVMNDGTKVTINWGETQ